MCDTCMHQALFPEEGRVLVVLDDAKAAGKELKLKRENMSLSARIKAGFLSQGKQQAKAKVMHAAKPPHSRYVSTLACTSSKPSRYTKPKAATMRTSGAMPCHAMSCHAVT